MLQRGLATCRRSLVHNVVFKPGSYDRDGRLTRMFCFLEWGCVGAQPDSLACTDMKPEMIYVPF